MTACPACGHKNPDGNRFCGECGVSLDVPAERREQRKTVTVVFCDVVGSTALGESSDPEALRALLARYFEQMRTIVERHGGTVEKFIGDAVMAVFGVPVLHEDDALRAVRAAVEMRSALPELGVEGRIGVSTGEVVAGTAERLVTGDAVNVAARLQQAAAPGEILLAAETCALVRDAVRVEALASLDLKGKAEPVVAFRLIAIEPNAPGIARHLDAAMVGRDRERRLLEGAFDGAVARQGCALFTVLGVAGVGKSRLVREFLAGVDARVVEGRCLSYGEGITYFPVVEVVKRLGGSDERLLAGSPGAAAAIGALLGDRTATTEEEIAWAVRRLLEGTAGERPLVVVFDDIHWGEPAFLDLIEYVADLSRDAPILLLCMARPELLDRRPGWSGGKLNATTVLLEPLDAGETEELIGRLLDGERIEPELVVRIRAAAEGNPLFLEEMLAMVRDAGERELVVPASIRALLAARLDQLAPDERSVLERGAVEGQLFHSAAVEALAPEPAPIERELRALVRKELLRPDHGQLQIGEAYRFRHLLIRDAAYDALPKASRAELHERFADWLAEHSAGLVERDEIIGYHLEQAIRYRAELGEDDQTRELGERAAAKLASAGRRATSRGDHAAAANMLERALALGLGDPHVRAHAQLELGEALYQTGRLAESYTMLAVTIDAATGLGDLGLAARARILRAQHRIFFELDVDLETMLEAAEQPIEILTELGDSLGLAWGERLLGQVLVRQGHAVEGMAAVERSLAHAEASGDKTAYRETARLLAAWLCEGPTPVDQVIRRCEELLESNRDDRMLAAVVGGVLSRALAMGARFDEAQIQLERASEVLVELNQTNAWMARFDVADAKELLGDIAGAEQELATIWQRFRAAGGEATESRAMRAASRLALLYCDEGRFDDAAECLAYGRELPEPTVFRHLANALHIAGRARLAAHRGEHAEALRLGRLAVDLAENGGFAELKALVWLTLAAVQRATGQTVEAGAAIARALEFYEQKGNIAAAARLRAVA